MSNFLPLLKSNFAGRDGFVWWIGRVAHPKYWKNTDIVMSQSADKGHRVKVRIIGYDSWDDTELKDEDLRWAEVLSDPCVGSGQGTRGETMNLVGGETAVGFFLDGDSAQQPVVMGLLHRSGNVENTVREGDVAIGKKASSGVFTADSTGTGTPPPTAQKGREGSKQKVAEGIIGQVQSAAVSIGEAAGEAFTSGQSSKGAYAIGATSTVENLYGSANKAEETLEAKATKEITPGSTCDDNLIGQLTRVLQDFIALSNTLEKTIDTYVDPVLNEVVDMTYQIKKFARRTLGIVKMILNNIRNGLFRKLTTLFSKFLGKLNIVNPLSYITTPAAQKGFMKVLSIAYCLFEKLLGELMNFLTNFFDTMLGRVINGPFCAAEQFVQSILAKVMDALEKLLEPILQGLDWLMGGIGSIKGILSQATSLANRIISFIGCDGLKCNTPSTWISSINGALEQKRDDWEKQVRGINVFKKANEELTKIEKGINDATVDIFTNGEYERTSYRGSNLGSILQDVDKLTGGEAGKAFNKGLDSIEAAIVTGTLFGGENSIFDACNKGIGNPQSQDGLMPMPIGYQYAYCLPPKVKIRGNGRGAKLRAIVGNRSELFSVEVVNGGKDYSSGETSLVIVDNSGYGSGAQARPIIKNGKIENVVITSSGKGYCANIPYSDPTAEGPLDAVETPTECSTTDDCPAGMECVNGVCIIPCDVDSDCPAGMICMNNMCVPIPGEPGIGTDVVGIVTFIQPETPGVGYGPDDTVIIGDEPCEECVTGITTNGSVIGIDLGGYNVQWNIQPRIRIESDTGTGAELIAIMEYKRQYNSDFGSGTRRRLVGITSVVDCVGDPDQLVGYVNGREYYGPFHTHPDSGVKMVGERHKSTPHAIIYNTKQESLGQSSLNTMESEDTQTSTPQLNTDTGNSSSNSNQGGGY